MKWTRETISMPINIAEGLKAAKKEKGLTKWQVLEKGLYAAGFYEEPDIFERLGRWILKDTGQQQDKGVGFNVGVAIQ